MSKSLTDIISTADPSWIDGTRIYRTGSGKWQVCTPSRFARGSFAIEVNADLAAALRDAWGPYIEPEAALTLAEMEE